MDCRPSGAEENQAFLLESGRAMKAHHTLKGVPQGGATYGRGSTRRAGVRPRRGEPGDERLVFAGSQAAVERRDQGIEVAGRQGRGIEPQAGEDPGAEDPVG